MHIIRSRLMTAFVAVSLASGVARVTSAQTYDLVTAGQQSAAATAALPGISTELQLHTSQITILQGQIASILANGTSGLQVTAPVNTVLPLISGTGTVGSVLTVSNGTWTQNPTSYAIQFYRTATTQGATPAAISGATTSSYTLASADVGDTITATVVASNTAGASSPATSLPTSAIVALGTITPTPTENYIQSLLAAYEAVGVVTAQPAAVTTPTMLTGNTGTQAELSYELAQVNNLASVLVVTAPPTLPTAPSGDTAVGSLTYQNYLQAEITAFQSVAVTTAAVPTSTPPGGTAAPGQVTGVVVTAGVGSLTVNALSVTATPPVTGYTIEVNGSAMAGATNVTLPYTITGLTIGTTYTINVAAVNQIGTGPYSDNATGTPINQPASANGTIVTALNAPIYDGAGHTATLVAGSNGNQVALEGTIDTTTSQVVELYTNAGVLYQLNSAGAWYTEPWTGGPGVAQSGSPIVSTTVPAQVVGVTVTPGATRLVVNATQNAPSDAVTGYTIKLNGAAATTGNTNVSLPHTITNLTAGTPVAVTVAAVNANGTGAYSNPSVSGTPTAGSTFTAQASSLPSVVYQVDAAEPIVSTAVAGTPGIQLDTVNGGVYAAEETGSGVLLTHGYGETNYVANGGPNNLPYFHDAASNFNNGYDGMVWPSVPASGNTMFQPTGAPWFMKFVMRQVAPSGNNNLFVYRSGGGQIDVQPTGTNGAIFVDQNNTSISGTESTTVATPPTAWQILDIIGDSVAQTIKVYRNGANVFTSGAGALGGLPQTTAMEIMNNCGCDVAFAEMGGGNPSITQQNAENSRLTTKYALTGIGTVTVGPSTAIPSAAAPVADVLADYQTTPIFPTTDNSPVDSGNTGPGDGLTMTSGTSSIMNLYFPGVPNHTPNITSEQQLRQYVYMNYFEGNLNQAIGSPMDTGQGNNNTFHAVARHYPLNNDGSSSEHSTTPVESDGLYLRAMCSSKTVDSPVNQAWSSGTAGTNCSAGSVYGGFVRFAPPVRPGMTIKVRYQAGAGQHAWNAVWLYSGEQKTPGPGGDPYQNSSALLTFPSGCNFEIDMNDNYTRRDDGGSAPFGSQVDFGTPNIYGCNWHNGVAPYFTFMGSLGSAFVAHPNAGPPYIEMPSLSPAWNAGFHDLVMSIRKDNIIDVFLDGQYFWSSYFDMDDEDGVNAQGKPIGMTFMLGNQAIPSFSPNPNSAIDNDGLTEGWTQKYQEISIYNGNVATPQNSLPSGMTNAVSGGALSGPAPTGGS